MKLFALLFSLSLPLSAFAKTTIGLNWKAEPEFGGFYTAQIDGLYKKHGLDVEIIEGGAGTPVVQMVAAGKIDFGTVSADEVILSQANGHDVVALYAVYQTAPYGIMVRESKKIKDFQQLFNSGITIALGKGLPMTTFLEKKYGFGKVKVVPYSGGISNFVNDENFAQQCFASSEPRLAENLGFKANVLKLADIGFNPYVTVLVANAKTIKEKPDMVKKMIQAVREGWGSYLKDPQATNKLISKLNPSMDMKALEQMVKIEDKFVTSADTKKHGLGYMSKNRWDDLVKQMVDLKLITKPVSSDSLYKNL